MEKNKPTVKEAWLELKFGHKLFLSAVVLVLVYFVFGGSSDDKSLSSKTASPVVSTYTGPQLLSGVEYSYFSDGSCAPSADKVCLDREGYLAICSQHPSFSKGALSKLGFSNSAFGTLAEAGFQGTTYDVSPNSQNPCEATATASGMVNGTSRKISVVSVPTTFIVNSGGQLVVTNASYLYDR